MVVKSEPLYRGRFGVWRAARASRKSADMSIKTLFRGRQVIPLVSLQFE